MNTSNAAGPGMIPHEGGPARLPSVGGRDDGESQGEEEGDPQEEGGGAQEGAPKEGRRPQGEPDLLDGPP